MVWSSKSKISSSPINSTILSKSRPVSLFFQLRPTSVQSTPGACVYSAWRTTCVRAVIKEQGRQVIAHTNQCARIAVASIRHSEQDASISHEIGYFLQAAAALGICCWECYAPIESFEHFHSSCTYEGSRPWRETKPIYSLSIATWQQPMISHQ